MIHNKSYLIEVIRYDNVKENINEFIIGMLKKHEIQWEPIVSKNSHQNKIAERAFCTIFNKVRFYLYDSKLSKYL